MGAAILARAPQRYRGAILVEGGFDRFTVPGAKKLAEGGTKRVLFACGQAGCETSSRGTGKLLERAGVEVRMVSARGEGHSYSGRVAEQVAAAFDWVVEGDPRFSRR